VRMRKNKAEMCKMCGEINAKGYPRLLAHTTAHHTSAELIQ